MDLVPRMQLAGLGMLINRCQAHLGHQPTDAVVTNSGMNKRRMMAGRALKVFADTPSRKKGRREKYPAAIRATANF